MATIQEYSLLSTSVYPRTDVNAAPLPQGWEKIVVTGNESISGFSAGAYKNGNEIVIAYTGTNEKLVKDFVVANIPAGIGLISAQVIEAMIFYLEIKNANPDAKITFTGHSLGGGLASLMAVFFDKEAAVFDAAPFEVTALNNSTLGYLAIEMTRRGLEDAAFSAFTADLTDSLYAIREQKVHGYSLEGEALGYLRTVVPTIEATDHVMVAIGEQTLLSGSVSDKASAAVSLHSMTLLAIMQISQEFADMVRTTPQSLKLFFDEKLYASDPQYSDMPNFLDVLLRGEISHTGSMVLKKIAADIGKIGGEFGMASTKLVEALIVVAMEYYYFNNPDRAEAVFSISEGAISFKYSETGSKEHKGLSRLIETLNGMLSADEAAYSGQLVYKDFWHIQNGADAMRWTAVAGAQENDAVIGGAGADVMASGAGFDMLIGGAGNDTLEGGDDGDYLLGGAGNDTYIFASGSGSDLIIDADGQGLISIDGIFLAGGHKTSSDYWREVDSNGIEHDYVLVANSHGGTDLIIGQGGSTDKITVRDWKSGDLGITLGEQIIVPSAIKKISGFTEGDDNYTTGSETVDILIDGAGGNDALAGARGNDSILGGTGNDLITGSSGADTILGGGGADIIFGSVYQFLIDTGAAAAVTTEQEVARGSGWVAFLTPIAGSPGGMTLSILTGDGSAAHPVTTAYSDTVFFDYGKVISGGAGDDYIFSGTGNDIAHGDEDNDQITGLAGADVLFGDSGNDSIFGDGSVDASQAGSPGYTPLNMHGDDILDGGLGADYLVGQGGNDTLYGGGDEDTLYGDTSVDLPGYTAIQGRGDDFLDGGDGRDQLLGGGGDDQLFGGDDADKLYGDDTPDRLDGALDGRDYLDGGDGADYMEGQGDTDMLVGGSGDDTIWGDSSQAGLSAVQNGADYLDGEDGDDYLYGGGSGDQLYGGAGNDTMSGDALESVLIGSSHGGDYLDGEGGNDDLYGDGGSDSLYGGDGNDSLQGDALALGGEYHGNDRLFGEAGSDTLIGGGGADELDGGDGDDYLDGDSLEVASQYQGADLLLGGAGNDTLLGGDGADTLVGGDGTDLMAAEAGNDILSGGAGNDSMDGGDGNDIADGGSDNDLLFGMAGDDRLGGDSGEDQLQGGDGNDSLDGGADSDLLFAGTGDDVLDGGIGNDRLLGEAGDDVLIGGTGDDSMSGGAGQDRYVFSRGDGNDRIIESGTAGSAFDSIQLGAGIQVTDVTLQQAGSDLVLVLNGGTDQLWISDFFVTEQGDLSADNKIEQIIFSDGNVWDTATIGSRILHAGAVTAFVGTAADDTFVIDNTLDTVTEAADQGIDTVFSSLDYALGVNLENLTLTGVLNIGAYGNSLANILTGNDGNNTLNSQGGNASDTMIGGRGDDTYLSWRYGDTIIEKEGQGIDTLIAYQNGAAYFYLPDNVENLEYHHGFIYATKIYGNSLDNVIVTDSREINDTYDGGVGADTIINSSGGGTFYVDNIGDKIVTSTGAYANKVYSSVNWTLSDYMQELQLMSVGTALLGTGNEWYNILRGNAYNNVLSGLGGNDSLYGGGGADTLIGGAGNDQYYLDSGVYRNTDQPVFDERTVKPVLIVEADDGGIDTVHSIFDYALTNNVENLVLDRYWIYTTSWNYGYAKTGIGNSSNNTITGNAGINLLDGVAGNDTLIGGQGDDTLKGGTGDDVYIINLEDGKDVIDNSASDSESATDSVRMSDGIASSDVVLSRAGDNLLITISPTQNLTVTSYFVPGNQIDRIEFADGMVWDTQAIGERLVVSTASEEADSIYGLAPGETIHALGGDDTLFGGDGDDRLFGDQGADSLGGGAGNDIYVFNVGDGQDTLDNRAEDYASAIDTIEFGVDIDPAKVVLRRAGQDLLVTVGVNDSIAVVDYFTNCGAGKIDFLTYSDGTIWDSAAIEARLVTSVAGAQADILSGADLNDTVHGLEGNDTIYGGDGNDQLYGDAGDDFLSGGGGKDQLFGGEGLDVMSGGSGDDVYSVDATGDQIIESAGGGVDEVRTNVDLVLSENVEKLTLLNGASNGTGNALNNTITGNSAANYLNGGAGADTMFGADGDDSYVIDDSGDNTVELANEGVDDVWAMVSVTLSSNMENLTLGTAYAIDGTGNELNNILRGNDSVNQLSGMAGNDELYGGYGDDVLNGGNGNDILDGGYGRDTYVFERGFGIDSIMGDPDGEGMVETLRFSGISKGEILVSRGASDLILTVANGGGRIFIRNWFEGDLYSAKVVTFDDGTVWDRATLESLVSLEASSDSDNVLYGSSGADLLLGLGGADTILGNDGDDILNGGTDNDYLAGGQGQDTYRFDTGSGADVISDFSSAATDTDSIVVHGVSPSDVLVHRDPTSLLIKLGGNDVIRLDGWFTDSGYTNKKVIFDNGEVWDSATLLSHLTLAPSTGNSDLLYGSAAADLLSGLGGSDTLYGLDGTDTLNGGDGDDTLLGGAGNDQLSGGGGLDTYVFDIGDGADTISDSDAAGGTLTRIQFGADIFDEALNPWRDGDDLVLEVSASDKLRISGYFAGEIKLDVLFANGNSWDNEQILTILANNTVDGSSDADELYGAEAYEVMHGFEGNDTLTGYGGNDTLDGGAGADKMIGGAGDDLYFVDDIGDVITEKTAAGTDKVFSSVTYTLASNVEVLTLTGNAAVNATGNTLNNLLVGNSAANKLTGGTGSDSMAGSGGDDIYVVDNTADVLVEYANEGNDSVQSSVTYALDANLEHLTLTGTSAINAIGNALDNSLIGNTAINTLTGGAGNDTLNGAAGADILIGGAGNDSYVVDNASDSIVENANEGNDTVQSSVTYTLAANVDNLTLTGSTAISGTGNALDNVVTGNTAANTLTGGLGNDTLNGGTGADSMVGGAGNDVYYLDNTADKITEAANEGNDTVNSSLTLTLGANLENLVLTGTAAVNGTGNELSNSLVGNAAVNLLTGAAGNDTLDGGAGNDTLTGGVGNDTYVLGRGYGTELIVENDAASGNTDVLQFMPGITSDQIWFRHVGNDLEVSIIGTSDKATLQNWYLGNQYHLEQFKTSDGKTLLDSKVQDLVSAMASFAPPAAGQTTLPDSYLTSLSPVIAADWRA
jgi:Ca2+-binding RTX toxin-like protein